MSPIGGVQKCIKYSQELYKANTPPLSKKKYYQPVISVSISFRFCDMSV